MKIGKDPLGDSADPGCTEPAFVHTAMLPRSFAKKESTDEQVKEGFVRRRKRMLRHGTMI